MDPNNRPALASSQKYVDIVPPIHPGFRTFNALRIASFHQLGDEPQFTLEFY